MSHSGGGRSTRLGLARAELRQILRRHSTALSAHLAVELTRGSTSRFGRIDSELLSERCGAHESDPDSVVTNLGTLNIAMGYARDELARIAQLYAFAPAS